MVKVEEWSRLRNGQGGEWSRWRMVNVENGRGGEWLGGEWFRWRIIEVEIDILEVKKALFV
jgi:hypothetical protein